ncbi:MAG TPA: sulfite exporter TauE/SafE family protein, partial [Lapillicoccus sp.]|nr:sulfite exporter TauE/SafE family protein [Lapillicoccus sp.]
MSVLEVAAIVAAGFAAGTINTIVGSGSLITFPTLLVLGYPPLTANVSNNIGLVPGGVSGSFGYREELKGRSRTLWRLGPLSFLGSIVGASLLLVLPPEAFKAI